MVEKTPDKIPTFTQETSVGDFSNDCKVNHTKMAAYLTAKKAQQRKISFAVGPLLIATTMAAAQSLC